MNFKEYYANVNQLQNDIENNLPFWEVRRFLPHAFVSGMQLYLTQDSSADGMDDKELLRFIRYMITFGGYTKEEVFDESKPETRDSTDLERSAEDDAYGPSSEEERLVRLAQSLLNGDGKLG
jgi:hypothetical protein